MGIKKSLILPALVVGSVGAGVAASSAIAGLGVSADSTTASTTGSAVTTAASTTTNSGSQTAPDPSKGGHTANGITETVLTGDTLAKATDAAKAAVSGGTVDRAESDAEGATYEVHMIKSDGTKVTVKLDSNFKVTATEDGMGAGGPGNGDHAPQSSSN